MDSNLNLHLLDSYRNKLNVQVHDNMIRSIYLHLLLCWLGWQVTETSSMKLRTCHKLPRQNVNGIFHNSEISVHVINFLCINFQNMLIE